MASVDSDWIACSGDTCPPPPPVAASCRCSSERNVSRLCIASREISRRGCVSRRRRGNRRLTFPSGSVHVRTHPHRSTTTKLNRVVIAGSGTCAATKFAVPRQLS